MRQGEGSETRGSFGEKGLLELAKSGEEMSRVLGADANELRFGRQAVHSCGQVKRDCDRALDGESELRQGLGLDDLTTFGGFELDSDDEPLFDAIETFHQARAVRAHVEALVRIDTEEEDVVVIVPQDVRSKRVGRGLERSSRKGRAAYGGWSPSGR